jgi:Curli production assembly/transport component CsgG/FecR protein
MRQLAVLLLAATVGPVWGQARLLQAQGQVTIDGRPAAAGATVEQGRITTGAGGSAQLRFIDGTLLMLGPQTQLSLPEAGFKRIALEAGGLRLATVQPDWVVELRDRRLRLSGFAKLQWCDAQAGCTTLRPGLYGSVTQGEAILDYLGGRSVLRNRHFRWDGPAERPELLAQAPVLAVDVPPREAALAARQEAAAMLKRGIEAFGAGDDVGAAATLLKVRATAPGEALVPYYLGLIALRRGDEAAALLQLQQYALEDPDGAAAREVPKTLTLLASAQLQQEVRSAVAREQEVASSPPEPGSIAVQAFVNKGDPSFRPLAKGLAAMIIADLSKVPGLKVLEREKVQLLVEEMKLGDAGLADPAGAVRSGRLMRAEKIIVGNLEVQ